MVDTTPDETGTGTGTIAPANGGSLKGPLGESIRAARSEELVPGKTVYYWSQSTNSYLSTVVNEPMGDDGYVNPQGKRQARLPNIYVVVQEEGVVVQEEGDDLPGLDLPAVRPDTEVSAGEVPLLDLAANGAVAANGADINPDDDDVTMSTTSENYVTEVLKWLRQLKEVAVREKYFSSPSRAQIIRQWVDGSNSGGYETSRPVPAKGGLCKHDDSTNKKSQGGCPCVFLGLHSRELSRAWNISGGCLNLVGVHGNDNLVVEGVRDPAKEWPDVKHLRAGV